MSDCHTTGDSVMRWVFAWFRGWRKIDKSQPAIPAKSCLIPTLRSFNLLGLLGSMLSSGFWAVIPAITRLLRLEFDGADSLESGAH